jgi:hypothetical protein
MEMKSLILDLEFYPKPFVVFTRKIQFYFFLLGEWEFNNGRRVAAYHSTWNISCQKDNEKIEFDILSWAMRLLRVPVHIKYITILRVGEPECA